MNASAIAVSAERRPCAVTSAWVIGRASDLTWLIGGVFLAYAFLGAHLFLGVTAVTIYMVWVLTVDGPHVFATLSRTYLDPVERAARARLLRWSLCFFALGPTSVGMSVLVGGRLPYDVFLTCCTLWAYWHVVRQHYGVMVLYERKAADTDPADHRIDSLALYVGLITPFVAMVVTHPQPLAMLGMDAPPVWASVVTTVAWSLFAATLLILAGRQLVRWCCGLPVNGTKLLFLTAPISLSAVLFSPSVAARIDYAIVAPIVTSFHDVQYLAIVWFFHQNRRAAPGRQRHERSRFTRSLATFLGAGVVFTLGYRVFLGCVFSAWPTCDMGAQDVMLPAGLNVSDLGVGFLWGFALHHYYLDQKIWHVRRDRALSRDLQLDTVRAPRPDARRSYKTLVIGTVGTAK